VSTVFRVITEPSIPGVETLYTGGILSFNGSNGRRSYIDQYPGATFSLTIVNDNDESALFVRGLFVRIGYENNQPLFTGRVVGIEYNDSPGTNQGLSTATIICAGPIAQCGKFNLDLTFFGSVSDQFQLPDNFYDQNIIPACFSYGSSSNATTDEYSGTWLNRMNLLISTEKGQLWDSGNNSFFFLGRQYVGLPSGYTFTRTAGSITDIPYSTFRRYELGDQFMNQVTVEPQSVSSPVAAQYNENAASVSAYGPSAYSVSTLDDTTTQAAGLASWLATMQGDPTDFRYEITVLDTTATGIVPSTLPPQTVLQDFVQMLKNGESLAILKWLKPGDVTETTVEVVCEGFAVNAVPGQTEYTFYFSSADFYQYFRLDDSIYGILGGSNVVYDQPQIEYNENRWIYNDSDVEQGSRLGW
jgi:hypothetical protein